MLKFLVIFEQGYLHFHFVYPGPQIMSYFWAPANVSQWFLVKKTLGWTLSPTLCEKLSVKGGAMVGLKKGIRATW